MPYNGAGAYSLPAGSIVADGTTIDAADHNTPVQDIETALGQVVLRNGVTPITGNQSMNSNKITSLANGTASTDAVNKGQLDAVTTGLNRLINGAMQIDQVNAGASISIAAAATGYPIDRWAVLNSGGATISAGRVAFGSFGFPFALRCTGAAGNTGAVAYQRIEAPSIADRAGLPTVLSAVLMASGSRTVTWSARYAGAADNWSSSTEFATGTWNVTASPQRFEAALGNLPSQAANGVQIAFSYGALGAGATVDVTGVQLEEGAAATQFERRPYGIELALCQRFLPVWSYSGGNDLVGFGYSISATQSLIMIPLPVTPRVKPAGISVVNPTFFRLRNGSNVENFATTLAIATPSSLGAQSITVNTVAGSPTIAAGQGAFLFSSTSPSQIVFTGCELN